MISSKDVRELTGRTTFTVTDQHLALTRNMYVDWYDCEFGAPAIDPKRPYGNSAVLADIAEHLGIEVPERVLDGEEDWPEELETRLERLHAETAVVLQIALDTGAFKAGEYSREKYGRWSENGD